ncbi:MAG: MaoC family dehydratase N-terminal domain-containing protein [Dehalococcoidia bacterium]
MAEASAITDEMRAAIGKESEPVTYEVDKTAVRMFARAVGYTDLIFYDEEYAKSKGYRSLPVPMGFTGHPIYKPGMSARPGPSFKTPFKRILNGGTDIEYYEPICAGDVLTATSKIADIVERAGSMGPMLFIISETVYKNQQGREVAKFRGTLIQY